MLISQIKAMLGRFGKLSDLWNRQCCKVIGAAAVLLVLVFWVFLVNERLFESVLLFALITATAAWNIMELKRATEVLRSSEAIEHAAELNLLAEKQRWLFTFLRQFDQFDGAAGLFYALKKNLPDVVSFSSLKLIVPSFLDRPLVLDYTREMYETYEINEEKFALEIENMLAGVGLIGRAYVSRAAVNWDNIDLAGYVQSILAIPLIYKEKTWGVLALESDSGTFSNEDVTLMNILSGNIGLYFEEQSSRSELDHYTHQLHQLHTLIHSLLLTHNRDHLLEGMLGYLKNVIPNSACAVYLFEHDNAGITKMERLAWYDEEDIPIPDNELVLKSAHSMTSLVEYADGRESRRVSPIVFQSRIVGAVDLCKPLGIQPKEIKMYQLLIDYVSSFWVLYDLIARREEEASVDPLTGIWNRRYIFRRFQEEADRIARYNGNACVVLGDMGNFKHINDNYGHAKGDEVLKKVAKSINKCLRISDSVGRYGGDEFIMLLPNITKADVEIVIDRINMELGLLNIKTGDDENDPVIDVILDFGAAIFPGEAVTLIDTIQLADEEMYAKKTARKKGVEQS